MPLDKDTLNNAEICFGTSCNFCEKGCPILKEMKVRSLSSRGKHRIMLGLASGRVKPSKELAEAILQ